MAPRGSWFRAIWAALISLPFPGLGHVYARRWRLGIVLLLIATVLWQVVLRIGSGLIAPTPAAVVALLGVAAAGLVMLLGIAVDAARRVRAGPVPERPRWFRSTWFTALMLVPVLFAMGLVPLRWHSFSVESVSMAPSLVPGDYVLAHMGTAIQPARGDVALFTGHVPGQPDAVFVKRVVGLPGDHVSVDQNGVVLNGVRLPRTDGVSGTVDSDLPLLPPTPGLRFTEQLPGRTYQVWQYRQAPSFATAPEVVVGPGTMFVLGDNRNNSMDSRYQEFGVVRLEDVVGVAGTIYWSSDRARMLTAVP